VADLNIQRVAGHGILEAISETDVLAYLNVQCVAGHGIVEDPRHLLIAGEVVGNGAEGGAELEGGPEEHAVAHPRRARLVAAGGNLRHGAEAVDVLHLPEGAARLLLFFIIRYNKITFLKLLPRKKTRGTVL
jgi:hypothetical protein